MNRLPKGVFLTSFVLSFSLSAAPLPAEEGAERLEDAPARKVAPGSDVALDEVEIRGEFERPKLFFILPRAQREATVQRDRIRFYPDILEPLDKDRFEEEARILYQHGIPAE